MSSDGFSDVDEDGLLAAASQVEAFQDGFEPSPRTAKRRRTDGVGTPWTATEMPPPTVDRDTLRRRNDGKGVDSVQARPRTLNGTLGKPVTPHRYGLQTSGSSQALVVPRCPAKTNSVSKDARREVDILNGAYKANGNPVIGALNRREGHPRSRLAGEGHVLAVAKGDVQHRGARLEEGRDDSSNDVTGVGVGTGADVLLAEELADLPSDAFASSCGSPQRADLDPIFISSQPVPSSATTLRAPLSGLRQTTLYGGTVESLGPASQTTKRHAWPMADRGEPPTHHKLDQEALKTWVYPTNLGTIRDYQYNVVSRGLYHNLLVALPTGLGKTFIAATVILNWFRWTKEAQIVFVAPTKPLVSQQVEACFGVAGIPRSKTTMLTGTVAPGLRAEEWNTKRVFFMTPQTIVNDLKSGICDPKKIVLLVVDEAHRATGGYAYVEVVQFLRRFNPSFRVLALTATPGASVEQVQQVIDGLDIARIEIRTEFSLDIRQYVHSRNVETVLFDNSEEMEMIMDLFSKTLQPLLSKLNGQNAYWSRDPMQMTAYGMMQGRQQWMTSDAGRHASFAIKGMINAIFTVLSSLAFSIDLLKYHGLGPFYHNLLNFRNKIDEKEHGGKYRKQIREDENFVKMMDQLACWINRDDFLGHPKLDYLQQIILNHFLDAGGGVHGADQPPSSTRIMVFAHWRDSAEEVVRVLNRHTPLIRAHVFVGQAATRGSEGMDQKRQLEVIQKFKTGVYNTLVATSIGEEGLDIGEIDLAICYDSSASPIRMLQRMGRTGRKRAGNIVLLLMRGKEEQSFVKAKDNYEKMQTLIASGSRFTFHDDRSPRIVPKEITPVVDKRPVEIPFENTQAIGELPEPRAKGRRAPKKPPKRFNMPDGVRTGFVKASHVDAEDDEEDRAEEAQKGAKGRKHRKSSLTSKSELEPELEDLPPLQDILLSASKQAEFERDYLFVAGDDQLVDQLRFEKHPDRQRRLGPTRYVKHGRDSAGLAQLMMTVHGIDDNRIDKVRAALRKDDVKGMTLDDVSEHLACEEDDERVLGGRDDSTAKSPLLFAKARLGSKSGSKRTPRLPAAPRIRGRPGKNRGTAYQVSQEAGLAEPSSPPQTAPEMCLPTQGISLDTSSLPDATEDEEPESDLRDFIDDGPIPACDLVEHGNEYAEDDTDPFSSSVPRRVTPAPEPFYISQQSTTLEGEDEDLPDVGTLMTLPDVALSLTGTIESTKDRKAQRRTAGRKIVVEDDDDE